ncbi:protein GRAVITROPIC IN THE LIGHT 1-like [Cynara cardunculus var. scolymus]|uniref:protein GRAVITROPIC IN THE LIGHT 1-like n=1 Tax=Cynara cardunculus var. scolymus TaxID=59895 RepID=UPI000D62921E|nr:protein GRAVITROPIC IN THE LIGHT 1-like [Cynara cardunculus var. scolymus]
MDSVNQSALTPSKTRLARTFTKVLHIRAATADRSRKLKVTEKVKNDDERKKLFSDENDEFQKRAAMDAFIAKVFATVSSVKAAYAQLQYAQSPYDAEGIQSADQIMVSELKSLSEFKQSFLKKHLDDNSPETTHLLAEIREQKNLLQMYEITGKKLDSQSKLKDSEIIFLKEKLDEANRENKSIEKRLNSSGPLLPDEKLHFPLANDFVSYLRQTTKCIRSFVRLMIGEMESANWDLDAAASSIQPNVVYSDPTHKCYAFESFICRVMFDGFNHPGFSIDSRSPPNDKRFFIDNFMELKSLKAKEYIKWKPKSLFTKFCWSKYLRLVHPVMEFSLFGNLNQRDLVAAGKFPKTTFFSSFADIAKRVWLLHCLAFAFDPAAATFQVRKGSRFTEVFMEGVNEEPPKASPAEVAFTVVPGFKAGKTVVQCQVYLS